MNKPCLGAHVSAAGGLYKAFTNAERIGAECVQIFGASPKMWRGRLPSDADTEKYYNAQKLSNVRRVYLHASYLVNLASDNPVNRENSVLSLCDHLAIAEKIRAAGLIFHLGSSKAGTPEDAFAFTVSGMKSVLEAVPGQSLLIMENSAGGGHKLGLEFSEIGRMLKAVGSPRVKVCLDTAHIFEAGGIDEYTEPKIKKLFDEFDKHIGLDQLVALHVNDSKTPANSHHDRHENLGQGHIGLDGFKHLAHEKRLWDKDWLLEVPGMDNLGPDLENMEILRNLFE